MRVVIALGGNALLLRGEPLTPEAQDRNIRRAAIALAAVMKAGNDLIVTHGNGPQVGLLALQSGGDVAFPLDVLGAETEGMIGYLLQRELDNAFDGQATFATLLTQIEVDPSDPAFARPTKPIGPGYGKADAERLRRERGWTLARDGASFRRVVASPKPLRILERDVIALLVDHGATIICAGGGGIPVAHRPDGAMVGVEAVIDKDHASGLLAQSLGADMFVMLTDVDAVCTGWGTDDEAPIGSISAAQIGAMSFAEGSMGPKVTAACDFVEATGKMAGIGALEDAIAIMEGRSGTCIYR